MSLAEVLTVIALICQNHDSGLASAVPAQKSCVKQVALCLLEKSYLNGSELTRTKTLITCLQ